jgi:hypothetical protein
MQDTPDAGPQLSLDWKGKPVVMPTFGVTLFTDKVLSQHGDAVLAALEGFLRLVPRDQLTFYRTETMPQGKPVADRTFGLLKTWLKKGAARREYIALDLNAASAPNAVSDTNFSVFGREEDSLTFESGKANWVRFSVPLERMRSDLDALEREAKRLFESMPFVSGYAGPMLELSLYFQSLSIRFAWKTVMRCRGFDMCNAMADGRGVGSDGVRSVNWLTFLGSGLAAEFGGAAALQRRVSKGTEVTELATGVCLRAGPRPELGDVYAGERLADYESVFRACEPAILRMQARLSPMMLETDPRENTIKLLRRLAYEDQ